VGSAYAASVAASGGAAPLRYVVEGLPPGLTYDAGTGALLGRATQAGSFELSAKVVDARGAQDVQAYALQVRTSLQELKLANWNLEWFGADKDSDGRELGPSDEALQVANVRDVMLSVGADVWAVQEVVALESFNTLKAQLPGYDGFLSSDARVARGADEYSPAEQKLALLYRSDRVQVLGTPMLLPRGAVFETTDPYAGRPPLRVDLRVLHEGGAVDLTVVVVHLKALTTDADYARRKRAAELIKQYLDQNLPTQRVLVLGDWNDDLDVSIASGNPTPFQNFLDDPADYTFLTKPFTDSNQGTTYSFSNAIDHQLATNDLSANYVTGSASIVKPAISGYPFNTSDHYPVTSRFAFP
jgi:endonuclease/exonuclease/phosphatase family metal-dependent hydrolase